MWVSHGTSASCYESILLVAMKVEKITNYWTFEDKNSEVVSWTVMKQLLILKLVESFTIYLKIDG